LLDVSTMRVLHLTMSTAHGGRRDAILTLIDHLHPLGVECGLLALRVGADDGVDLAGRLDYYDALDLQGRPTVRELVRVARICHKRKVQIVHAHDGASQFVASMLRCVSPSLRVVMTFHRTLGIETEGWRNRVRNAVTLPLVERVLTASEERRRYFLSTTAIASEKVVVIPLGVDRRQFCPDLNQRAWVRQELGLSGDTVLIVAAGHFSAEKGIDQVIEGVAEAIPGMATKPWHLVVLGTGEARRITEMEGLGRRRLGSRVTFLGFRQDVPRWLQGADLLVHAPRMEAFGLVVIQAMACGVPVVATAVGGIPEIVVDGETGILVAPGRIEALGAAVSTLAMAHAQRRRFAEAAVTRAASVYDARLSAERHFRLYQDFLRPAAAARVLPPGAGIPSH
jgi:glycosyltransferase involved in cell wall biosynthesis